MQQTDFGRSPRLPGWRLRRPCLLVPAPPVTPSFSFSPDREKETEKVERKPAEISRIVCSTQQFIRPVVWSGTAALQHCCRFPLSPRALQGCSLQRWYLGQLAAVSFTLCPAPQLAAVTPTKRLQALAASRQSRLQAGTQICCDCSVAIKSANMCNFLLDSFLVFFSCDLSELQILKLKSRMHLSDNDW